jgi:hypothetical protein
MHTRRLLIILGALILMIGSRLPWMSVPILFGVEGPTPEAIEVGWEDNGIITGVIGLILLFGWLFLGAKRAGMYSISGAVLAALSVLVVVGCAWRVIEINPTEGFLEATDVGLYVTLLGGLLALYGAMLKPPVSMNG